MRHGRAKAARKTLQHFQRTVNLKSKPYYSVLLDATFLIAMIRITANNSSTDGSAVESTIVSRIERVLQVNNAGGAGFSRDERLSGVMGEDNNNNRNWNEPPQQNNNSNSGHRFERYKVRYFVPQEAVDEIETILKTFQERSENTKKKKKQEEYKTKSKVFEDALAWIKKNSSRRHSHRGSGRCEVLPNLAEALEAPSKKKKKGQQSEEHDSTDDNEQVVISASEAIQRHIARDDGREDPETNQKMTKKQQQSSFSRTYIVASQEEDLLNDLRMLGTVPILRCANNASVLILENPSKKGQRTDTAKEHSKWKGALQNPAEKALVDAAWEAQKKSKIKITGLDTERRRSKAKGANPLSCKRKRTETETKQQAESKSKKRRARAKRNKSDDAATASARE
mmetsp:Transcript_2519/g.6065  ORF Transcript_2519/g.6065 Transcript_2519/m.6065 type:complete len:397 (-) Transcript_2519:468-1658(-)